MIKNKLVYVGIFFITFFLSYNRVNAYTYDTNITGQDPYYDITSLSIENDILTVSGWAYVNNKDNGKFSDGKVDFIPAYTIFVKDENGNIAKDSAGKEIKGSYYYGDNKSVPSNPFSVTCLKFTNNGGGSNTAQDCMNAPTYGQRNNMIESSKNQSPYKNQYYDGVDFQIKIDISGLQHDIEYHLELQMKIGNSYSNTVPLLVYEGRVNHDSQKTKIEVKNLSDSVRIIADLAKFQYASFSYAQAKPIQDGCWFLLNGTYKVDSLNPEKNTNASNNNAVYYYYGLQMKKGAYRGTCSNIIGSNKYKINPASYIVWAHASWVQPSGHTGIIIERKNPCVDGTETESAKEYAISHPGACCYEIPETCCGNKIYIEELYDQNPNHYIFSDEYCCSKEDAFIINNKYYNGDSFYTFNHYFPNNELESYKNIFWRQQDGTRFYSQSYIDKICKNPEWKGVACPPGTTKDESSTVLNVEKINKNNIPNKIIDTVDIYLDKIDGDIVNKIGWNFFTNNDFEDYLRKNKKNANFKEENQNNSLNKKHFVITRMDFSGPIPVNGKYKYTITFEITITSTTGVTPSKDGNYYLPIKFWYCTSNSGVGTPKNSCNDNVYFQNHKSECCKTDPTKAGCSCAGTPGEICYTWSNASKCTAPSAEFATTTNTETKTNGDVTTSENITFSEYPKLSDMQSASLKAGEGFMYEVDVTHTIKTKGIPRVDSTCNGSGCGSNIISDINDFVNNNITRNTNEDMNAIKNLKYKFDGKTSNEDYDIVDVKVVENGIDGGISKTITICESIWDGYDWYDNCYPYPYKPVKIYTYTYKLRLKPKYISKLHNAKEEEDNIISVTPTNPSEYLDGGNKFYTKLKDTNGIYPINISLSGTSSAGLTGNLTGVENFSCQYEIIGGIKNDHSDNYYYFRPISLFSPFPNGREIGHNWDSYCVDGQNCKYITKDEDNKPKQDLVYSNEPLYQIKLTSELIKQIKNYNESQGYDYGWNNMTTHITNNTTSNFLNNQHTSIISWEDNLKINTNRNAKVGEFE